MKGFDGVIVTQTDCNGKIKITYHKSQKGLMRDHRKHKCDAFCSFCYHEANEWLDKESNK